MIRNMLRALLLLLIPATTMTAQHSGTSITMHCETSDGIVVIAPEHMGIADYHLKLDEVIQDGVARYSDERSGAHAILDARDDEGLYILVTEGGIRMQIVAARSNIRYEFKRTGSEPASPSFTTSLYNDAAGHHSEKR